MMNVPEIRFKGFADAWVQRKFEDDISLVGGATPYKQNADYWNGDIVLSSQEIKEKYVASGTYMITKKALDDNVTRAVKSGTPLIVTRSGVLANRLPISIPTVDVAINQDIKALVFDTDKINTDYFVAHLQKLEDFILKWVVKGGTTVQSVDVPDLQKMELRYPSIKEQEQIGTFFRTLDSLIAANQRKVDGLKQVKSAYLQQLFPQIGARVPRVRFEGFTGDWEIRKLGDCFVKGGSGGTPLSTKKEYYDGDIPFLSISDVTNSNGYIDSTEKKITEEGLNNSAAWIVSKGAISLAMYASVGKLAILNIDAATSQAFYNMIFGYIALRDFIYQRLSRASEFNEWTSLISQGTQQNLNAEKVKNFEISVPSNRDEQEAIGIFLNNIDTQISAHSDNVQKLKVMKNAYLQKMFI